MKRLESLSLTIILVVGVLASACVIHPVKAGTITVPDDYPTIQEAINNANEGDTIFVRNGTYYEHVVVNETLTLVGEERDSVVIDGSGNGTVVTATNDNINLTGFTIQDSGFPYRGVQLDNVSQCSISGNNITNNWYDLDLYSCSNNSVTANSIENGYYGIWLHDSSNHNTISMNSIMRTEWAISLFDSSSNSIHDNYAAANLWGITFSYSSNNLVYKNNFTANTAEGILLGRSSNNSIYYNSFEKNEIAVELSESGNNAFYHNNFLNNTHQVDFLGSSFDNAWDNTCEGNYWSDYSSTDSDYDGIGDTPYIIDSNNIDHCPLMNPYWIPADVNHDLKINIFDVVKITGAYGATPASPYWNPHADIAQPFEKIDIFDIVLCTGHYGEKYP